MNMIFDSYINSAISTNPTIGNVVQFWSEISVSYIYDSFDTADPQKADVEVFMTCVNNVIWQSMINSIRSISTS